MIELHGVSKSVPSGTGTLTILHPTDLIVPAKEVVAITGASGSGKSTLLGLIAGLDSPTTGRIIIDGVDITSLDEDALAKLRGRRIGFVFQFFHLLPSLTALENILVPMEIAGLPDAAKRARSLLDEVGLSERGHHYPSQLSGGEQQRIAIARALANDPPLLLADEPTGNLDSSTGRQIIDLLLGVHRSRGTTLVLVTHDPDLARVAHMSVALRDGRVVSKTTNQIADSGSRTTDPGSRTTDPGSRTTDPGSRTTDPGSRTTDPGSRTRVMTFVLKMIARELRASWRRLLFFFICVAIGVAAIVTLRSIIQSVRTGLMREARGTIASDVLIQSSRPWTPEVRAGLEPVLSAAPVQARTESIETATMVRAEQGSAVARMVELRGVEAGYPFYGTLALENGQSYSHTLVEHGGALVRPELLAQLAIKVGDRILIGGHPFTVRGVIDQEPGRRVGGFSLGSRVLIDLADLRQIGLLTFGSRANYQLMLKVREDGVDRLTRQVNENFRDRFVNARSYRSTEDQIGESLQRAENFLSLVGFIIVVLGGIGVWSVTRVFVRQKIKSVAILKCVGASTPQVLTTYVVQVALLAIAGSLIGVGLAAVAIRSIPASLAESFGGLSYGLTPSAVLQGLAVGLLVSVLFALVPLFDVRRIKPLLLIRGADGATPVPSSKASGWRDRLRRIDWLQIALATAVGAALIAVASWQAGSWRAGAAVTIGFAVVAAVLYVAAFLLIRLIMPLASAPWFPLRHAVISLRRPGNQTRVILLAVGLGSFFVLGVRALQSNLVAEFAVGMDRGGADMFIIDVQRDQAPGVEALLQERQDRGATPARLVPVLRARVTAVRGREVNLENFSDVRGRGSLAREYVITYRDHLESNEHIVQGAFWKPGPDATTAQQAEVSVEEGIHERFNIQVGDEMRFDVLGRQVLARVTSVRHVEWGDARSGGFMFVFRPGAFAGAPHTYIGFVKGPDDPTARARLQYDLIAKYPNITAIDGREIIARIQKVIDNAVLGISVVGGIALLSGVLILIGAVAMTKFQRVYESAIFRTLGASTRLLTMTLALEYGALGLLAGTIGAAGALGLSWGVTRHVFDIPWRPVPGVLAVGAVLTTALVCVIGVIASIEVLRRKPLSTLRAE